MHRILLLLALALATPATVLPEEAPAPAATATLGIAGTEGARVEVDGDSIGTLPMGLLSLPLGEHEVRVSKRGHETRTIDVRLGPLRGESRAVTLHPKRKRDALWRNLFVPGWGVAYGDHRLRGALTFAVEAGFLGFAYYENGRFEDRRDEYEAADQAYRRAVGDAAIAEARAERESAYDRMESSESNRDGVLLAAAVVYGLSALDAYFRFPYGSDADGGHLALGSNLADRDARAWVALRFAFE